MSKRPFRAEFFARFGSAIASSKTTDCRVLELGSGPGFLAEYLLGAIPNISYSALDFSAAMHELARIRLGSLRSRVTFIERDFRMPGWADELGKFDFVITLQAIHELRHKRHAPTFHRQVKNLILDTGSYFVCDHFHGDDGMPNDQLYMTVTEHSEALLDGGFKSIEQLMLKGGLVMYQGWPN